MAYKLDGNNPLAYMGVKAPTPPNFVKVKRAPTAHDYSLYNLGDLWLDTSTLDVYMLVNKSNHTATWTLLGASWGSGLDGQVIIGATGALPVWAYLTSPMGSIVFTAGPNTLGLDLNGNIATKYTTNGGAASPLAGTLNILGTGNIQTSGAGNTVSITMTGGNDGQVLIGSTAGASIWNNITSTDGSITIANTANHIDLKANYPATNSAFSAYSSVDQLNVTGDDTIYLVQFDTELFDEHADYDHTTGIFTAPQTGHYSFNAQIGYKADATGADQVSLKIFNDTIGVSYNGDVFPTRNQAVGFYGKDDVISYQIKVSIPATAGNQISVKVQGGNNAKADDIIGVASGSIYTYFSGYLLF